MEMFSPIGRPTVARIDLSNLTFNFKSVREFIGPDVRCMAVIKADAYGHGAVHCGRRLEADGADWLGVATLEEAIELRDAGIRLPILCLGGVWPGQEETFFRANITPIIFDLDSAARIDRAASGAGRQATVHVKIDTGMGRVGVPHADAAAFAAALRRFENLEVSAIMSHLAAADDLAANDFTDQQTARLQKAVAAFAEAGIRPSIVDLANSPGAVAHPDTVCDMVRLGGVLFGLGGDVLPKGVPAPELKPVMSWATRLAMVKPVPAGMPVGYGRTFVTDRPSIIGTIPVGYHDGYRRGLSNKGRVLVHGQFAPVVGRVSMDWTMIDLTDVPEARTGDQVILIGAISQNAIRAEDLAAELDTLSYEVTCGVSRRVPRIYE
jgi:alanine racemase